MVCTKCGRPHAGYRCPYCGRFAIDEETAGTLYSREMKRHARQSALATFGVIMVFGLLIGSMVVGVFFQGGYANDLKNRKKAKEQEQIEKQKEEQASIAELEMADTITTGEVYSDEFCSVTVVQLKRQEDGDLDVIFQIANPRETYMLYDLVQFKVNGQEFDYYDGLAYEEWADGETKEGFIRIYLEDLQASAIEHLSEIEMTYEPVIWKKTDMGGSGTRQEHISFTIPCNYDVPTP